MVDDVMKAVRYVAAILVLGAVMVQCGYKCVYPNRMVCARRLAQINSAKRMWAIDKDRTTNDVPVMADLTNYTKEVLVCPEGGTYTLGPVWKDATCSIKGHALPK